MNQLKPMIIVLLMLTSALAGCTGTGTSNLEEQIVDLEQSNDEMEDTISQQNIEISLLQELYADSISDAETERSSLLEQLEVTIGQKNNEISMLQELYGDSISDAETERDSLLEQLEEADNTIQKLNEDFLIQHNLVVEWIQRAASNDFSYANMSNLDVNNSVFSSPVERHEGVWQLDMSNANLTGADLSNSILTNTSLWNAIMRGANLRYADLSNSVLWHADLRMADLTGADLSDADLSGAILIPYAGMAGADLTNVYWYNTICPDETNSDDNGNTCVNNL